MGCLVPTEKSLQPEIWRERHWLPKGKEPWGIQHPLYLIYFHMKPPSLTVSVSLVNHCFTFFQEGTYTLWLGWHMNCFLAMEFSKGIWGYGCFWNKLSNNSFGIVFIPASRAIWCLQFLSFKRILRWRKGWFLALFPAGLGFSFPDI